MKLGGNIELEGFESLDKNTMVVVKKVVGNFVKKASENRKINGLKIILKKDSEYQIDVEIYDGEAINSGESSDRNLFFALNKALEKAYKQKGL